jgi:hypothetical protein
MDRNLEFCDYVIMDRNSKFLSIMTEFQWIEILNFYPL